MFERFTERARQVIVLAQDEARELGHNYLGTEHLLLGVLREEEGIGARVLESLGISTEEARAQLVRIVGSGDEPLVSGQIPFTPRAKKVLELSLKEARSLGHQYIGTEHILLGIARVHEGVAAQILLSFDADADRIRDEVDRLLGGRAVYARPVPRPAGAESVRVRGTRERRVLDFGSSFVTLPEALAIGAVAGAGLGILIGWAIWGL